MNLLHLLIIALLISGLQNDDLSDRAREIFEELDERRQAVTYETSIMNMTLHDSRGRTRSREVRSWNYNDEGVTKTLIVFENPADVRGTGLLTINEEGNERQQIYLPSVGRVQTISSSQRGDRFMGSDFTYEDLGAQNPDDFSFEEMEHTDEQYKIKATPESESEYAWIIFFIDRDRYVLDKAEYYNKDGKQYKELVAENYRELDTDIWRADTMTMYDLKNETKTELRWSDRTINEPIPDRYFTERQLQRGVQ